MKIYIIVAAIAIHSTITARAVKHPEAFVVLGEGVLYVVLYISLFGKMGSAYGVGYGLGVPFRLHNTDIGSS